MLLGLWTCEFYLHKAGWCADSADKVITAKDVKCPHCGGDHPACSFNLTKYKEEKAILSYHIKKQNIFQQCQKKNFKLQNL